MELHGSLSGELLVASPVDRFFKFFTDDINTPFADLVSVGFHFESKDLEKRTVTMNVLGYQISDSYKTIKATFTVTPKEVSGYSFVAWTLEFEKIRHDIKDPLWIADALVSFLDKANTTVERRYHLNWKIDSIDVESQADECFKAFMEAFKDDATVEIEAKDWETRTSTMRLMSSHVLIKNKFKTLKVTITITPMEDSDGSHVAWTIESEKISEDIIDPDLTLDTAVFIREIINEKLLNKVARII